MRFRYTYLNNFLESYAMLSIHTRVKNKWGWLTIVLLIGILATHTKAYGEKANQLHFSLTDHHGEAVTEKDFTGYFLLIFFGYSHCPDICPINISVISKALDDLGPSGKRVQPIFITLDPKRDTLKILKSFVHHFHSKLIGLTGSPKQIEEVAATFFVRYERSNIQADDIYLLDHTAATYLIGPAGEGLIIFPHNTAVPEMVTVIQSYINSHSPAQ
jgi:cytochrome oxidase Cu insertion factor (SCO1/SenC/PrrC family)